ncbi:MAG: DMT family transporter [Pelagimonas sp.]|uniref:DMT family transporter n=1 Tax=Pelagimonas sp. TaxID=2073170 RepID=UPI003D6A8347
MTQTQLTPYTWGALLLLAAIWGGSFLAIRTALDEIGPLTSVFYRTSIAAVFLWLVMLARHDVPKISSTLWIGFGGMGLLNNVIPFCLMAWGQLYIETGLTSILNASTAIFGVLVAALVFADEKLTLRKTLGVGVGFIGVVVAIGPSNLLTFDITSTAQFAVIAGTFSYALAGAWGRLRLGGLSALHASAGMLTASSIMMTPLMLIFEGVPSVDLAVSTWMGVLYFALIATAAAYLLYYKVLALAGAGNLLLVTLLIPPVAIVLGALVRGENLMPSAYLGFALLALGLAILDPRLTRRKRMV